MLEIKKLWIMVSTVTDSVINGYMTNTREILDWREIYNHFFVSAELLMLPLVVEERTPMSRALFSSSRLKNLLLALAWQASGRA